MSRVAIWPTTMRCSMAVRRNENREPGIAAAVRGDPATLLQEGFEVVPQDGVQGGQLRLTALVGAGDRWRQRGRCCPRLALVDDRR